VLNKHVTPWMYGPPIMDDKGQIKTTNKYIEVDDLEGGSPIGMLVWDAQLGAVAEAIRDQRQAFAMTAGVDIASILPREVGGATSGRALRIEQMNTQGAAQDKQQAFLEPLQRLYSVISQLAVQPYVQLAWQPTAGEVVPLRPDQISVTYGDGLPSTAMDDIEEEERRLTAGNQSIRDSIMRLDGLSQQEADEKLARIQSERQASAPSSLQSGLFAGQRSASFASVLQPPATAPGAQETPPPGGG
jgi:hypothetical protein